MGGFVGRGKEELLAELDAREVGQEKERREKTHGYEWFEIRLRTKPIKDTGN